MQPPKTFLIGHTMLNAGALLEYLRYTDQEDFMDDVQEYVASHDNHNVLHDAMAMVSCFAKMCYRSLVMGKNRNLTGTRDIESNLRGVIDSRHGAVLEHVTLNFITTGCSRVFTHELVRHRAGTAFSQTSGRYVSLDDVQIVLPPELQPHQDEVEQFLTGLSISVTVLEERVGLQGPEAAIKHAPMSYSGGRSDYLESLGFVRSTDDEVARGKDTWTLPFETKKRLTSAIRRIAPNGQTNEIAWSCNLRALRHMIELRTSRHAEWEIRHVFNEVADLIFERCPVMLYGGSKSEPDAHYGLCEWTGLHV